MKEQIPQPTAVSRTLQGKTREANTASVTHVLQAYKKDISQRQEIEDEDELLQGRFETSQRDELEDDELLQGKFETAQLQETPNNTGLPDNLKAGVEQLSGLDMSDVQVHYNSSKPASVQAYAYTQGTDIHVAPGQEKHLGHEAWHVAQQKQGRVQPTTTVGGMPVNDNAGLENEADVMGAKAVQMKGYVIQNFDANKISIYRKKNCVSAYKDGNVVSQRFVKPLEWQHHELNTKKLGELIEDTGDDVEFDPSVGVDVWADTTFNSAECQYHEMRSYLHSGLKEGRFCSDTTCQPDYQGLDEDGNIIHTECKSVSGAFDRFRERVSEGISQLLGEQRQSFCKGIIHISLTKKYQDHYYEAPRRYSLNKYVNKLKDEVARGNYKHNGVNVNIELRVTYEI
jgi:hypothetical protein